MKTYISKLYKYFSDSKKLAFLNGILIVLIILLNLYFQAFCIPTTWALITALICFINSILFPFLEKTKFSVISSFINGISVFVYLYIILFLGNMNLVGLILSPILIGLFFFVPHFLLFQLIWKTLVRPKNKSSRLFAFSSILSCILVVFLISKKFQNAQKSIEAFKESNYKNLEKNFMTEKILGMHFIYHTRIEMIYDGWRPPKHEPFLVIGMWLNGNKDPLPIDLKTRFHLFRKFFPEKTFKYSCSCGIMYSENYHQDKMWNK